MSSLSIDSTSLLEQFTAILNTKLAGLESNMNTKLAGLESNMNTKLAGLESNMNNMNTKLDGLELNMKKNMEKVDGLELNMTKNMEKVDKRFTVLEKKINSMNSTLNRLVSQSGEIAEAALRQEISKTLGSNYSRSFKIRNLEGLARICLPKKERLWRNEMKENSSPNVCLDQRMNALQSLIGTNKIDDDSPLLKYADEQVKAKIKKYNAHPECRIEMNKFDPLGLMLFLIKFGLPPQKEIEIDCRGTVVLHGEKGKVQYFLEVGEIKKDVHDKPAAQQQLELVVDACLHAAKLLLSGSSLRKEILMVGLGRFFHLGNPGGEIVYSTSIQVQTEGNAKDPQNEGNATTTSSCSWKQ